MILIRNAQDKDLESIFLINQLNSSNPNKPPKEKEFCLYLYAGYYMKMEKENCFVAYESETDEVLGYILGSRNYESFLSMIENDYLEKAEELGFKQRFLSEIHAYERFKDEYPAHFHIDVKPGNQHKGIGSRLLDEQLKHLRNEGAKGVMLLVGKNKEAANHFYEKNGMAVIAESQTTFARGKKL
ncbi:MAG: GNAT family N-acetyltransferase [Erysipelotrichaceae bacterium]|nr:GNAT family N-acetyltransferase [Erysipelotrichaceae bacterium]